MKKLQSIATFFIAVALFTTTIIATAPSANAQFSGINGNILWTTPANGQYIVQPSGAGITNTGIATLTGYAGDWQSIYLPGSQYIIYVAKPSPSGKSNLYVTNAANSITPVAITSFTTCDVSDPASNSNGTKIAFSCETDATHSDIYVLDLNINGGTISSANQLQLTNNLGSTGTYNPVWAPDNSKIYVRKVGAAPINIGAYSISPTSATTTLGSQVCNIGSFFELYDVNPVNTYLLYKIVDESAPELHNQLFMCEINGDTTNINLTSFEDPQNTYYGAYFSPDGKFIVASRLKTATETPEIVTSPVGYSVLPYIGTITTILSSSSPGIDDYRPFWGSQQPTPGAPSVSTVPRLDETRSYLGYLFMAGVASTVLAIAVVLMIISKGKREDA